MAETINNLCIVLLTRSRLEIYDLNQKKVFPFNIPASLFRDMEIINKNELETQLSLFINFYKVKPMPVLIILANDIYFDTEIANIDESALESIINNFLYYLPFEESIHKIYKQTKGYYLFAVNKGIVETLKYIFTKIGFNIEGIVPSGITGIDIKTIDAASADYITAKIREIKNQSIIVVPSRSKEKNVPEKKVLGINRVFMLLAVFLVLLVTLLFLLYKQSIPVKKSANLLTSKIDFSRVELRG